MPVKPTSVATDERKTDSATLRSRALISARAGTATGSDSAGSAVLVGSGVLVAASVEVDTEAPVDETHPAKRKQTDIATSKGFVLMIPELMLDPNSSTVGQCPPKELI